MENLSIQCPNCRTTFELENSFLNNFKSAVEKDFQQEYQRLQEQHQGDVERARIEIRKQTQDQSLLTIKSKDKLIKELNEQLSKIKQKIENTNTSQQAHGEIQELELENILTETFSTDIVKPVPKGVKGADCTLTIRSKTEHEFGKIMFESKRTQTFSPGWIEKLKDDSLANPCQALVIITSTMPKGVESNFTIIDGIYICKFDTEAIKQLVCLLRYFIIKIYQITNEQENGTEKAHKLFQYTTSTEFHTLMERILKGFENLESTFQQEKKRFTEIHKIKEQQLQTMLENTLEVYSEICSTVRGMSTGTPNTNLLSESIVD